MEQLVLREVGLRGAARSSTLGSSKGYTAFARLVP